MACSRNSGPVEAYCGKCKWCRETREEWSAAILKGMREAGRDTVSAVPVLKAMPLAMLREVHLQWGTSAPMCVW